MTPGIRARTSSRAWRELGRLQGLPATGVPRNARFDDAQRERSRTAPAPTSTSTAATATAPKGPADTSGLWLDAATNEPLRLGLCKPPVAAGQGTGDHLFDIVPGQPEDSILVYRMASLDPGRDDARGRAQHRA